MKSEGTFLTESQEKVLKLRSEGLSQSEIAEKLGTSRSNICSLEKRARQNIKKAEKTVKLAKKIQSPVFLTIEANEDIFDAVKRLFSKANKADIHVSSDTPTLISKIRNEVGEKLEGRKAIGKIKLYLTPKGEVIIT
ncbi:hypothetical protein AKJ37_00650 [candidate division MSBL1 archaeon SCGC-AAA259I09]|uniref:HTH cro/C1-type domain-containing protein n=4 Tax=candidate division MSBL1 TaxID=215777 RepID=A0A133UVQ0_9EURY|nr:hypothetical protein AKJ61_00980 [candidate division MSBL1 archaeon SCGC-AAA259B11]KXA98278.1 hypothetical protein AKJ37_00650 [candidate division MSBL1 archaeon SCGC-AAA259I09]KXA98773.1 hypothetical protein AKJ39_00870 [candidate division MSBL1 archaeon SCGC-AAA259J03]KXB00831.1 hypothetical protein AKJ40_00255 [candidate division MSBL1 archaeon SCGC-AAA259M10]